MFVSVGHLDDASIPNGETDDAKTDATKPTDQFLVTMFDFIKEMRLVTGSRSSRHRDVIRQGRAYSGTDDRAPNHPAGLVKTQIEPQTARTGADEAPNRHVDHQACLENFFCNLPVSSGILANHHSQSVQNQQLTHLSMPRWAMMCIKSGADPGPISAALEDIRDEILASLKEGLSWDVLVGPHPYVAALFDEDGFTRAPRLSQWAASMVHSVKQKGMFVPNASHPISH